MISGIVIIGLPISYFPQVRLFLLRMYIYIYAIVQHFRIIKTKSSEGLSPLFLLLGSTSATAGMWNMYAL